MRRSALPLSLARLARGASEGVGRGTLGAPSRVPLGGSPSGGALAPAHSLASPFPLGCAAGFARAAPLSAAGVTSAVPLSAGRVTSAVPLSAGRVTSAVPLSAAGVTSTAAFSSAAAVASVPSAPLPPSPTSSVRSPRSAGLFACASFSSAAGSSSSPPPSSAEDMTIGSFDIGRSPPAPHASPDRPSPLSWYRDGLASGAIREDPRQLVAVRKLDRLFQELLRVRGLASDPAPRGRGLTVDEAPAARDPVEGEEGYVSAEKAAQAVAETTGKHAAPGAAAAAPGAAASSSSSSSSSSGGLFGWLNSFVSHSSSRPSSDSSSLPAPSSSTPRGVYLYGGVGAGKTMLMDGFVETSPPEFAVRRTHYHDFMLEVHQSLRTARRHEDPLALVAADILQETKVLCLDELFVNDVADAMILARLFAHLWSGDFVLVATSNRAPKKLYENGLQRQLFLPFIAQLEDRCDCHDMDSAVDYRQLAQHLGGRYFVGPNADDQLEAAWETDPAVWSAEDDAGGEAGAAATDATQTPGAPSTASPPSPKTPPSASSRSIDASTEHREVLPVAMGRELVCLRSTQTAAFFAFPDLCERPLGAADYIALAEAKHTLYLSDIPIFVGENKSAGYRFVTLIDVLYEHRVRLVASAQGSPLELFQHISTYEQDQARKKERLEAQLERAVVDDVAGPGGAQATAAAGPATSSGDDETDEDSQAVVDDNLGFSKDRTISRLTEMQSKEYSAQHIASLALHLHNPGAADDDNDEDNLPKRSGVRH